MKQLPRLAAATLAALGFAASAGTVEVTFVNPENFIDAGNASWDESANLEALGAHIAGLGRLLPGDQTVKIEVLNVDLAGQVRARGMGGVRTVNGRGDFPRMQLRYIVSAAGQPARTGEEWISDVDYARGVSVYRKSQPLYYDKRMVDNWFNQRFVPRVAQN